MPLTDVICRKTKPAASIIKLSDGGGLQLWVHPRGSRLWRLAYRFAGKQKLLAIGAYPLVTLAAARAKREDAKRMLAAGTDPSAERKQAKLVGSTKESFQVVAKEYIEKRKREGKAATTIAKNEWLMTLAYPDLGERIVDTIKSAEILEVLRKVERRGHHETARRLRAVIGGVFRYAVATSRAETDPTFSLRDALIAPVVIPRAAVTEPSKVGALLRAIDDYDGSPVTRAALKLMALTFPRPGELRLARWPEFDLPQRVWRIPAARMKMRRTHDVPLSRQAIGELESLKKVVGASEMAFPSFHARGRPLSENTLNSALRRMGYGQNEASSHGFRSTASTLLNQSRRWHPDAIERQLAHVDGNKVRAAYDRADHWDERVRMMQWWADYLDQLREAGASASYKAA